MPNFKGECFAPLIYVAVSVAAAAVITTIAILTPIEAAAVIAIAVTIQTILSGIVSIISAAGITVTV